MVETTWYRISRALSDDAHELVRLYDAGFDQGEAFRSLLRTFREGYGLVNEPVREVVALARELKAFPVKGDG